MKPINVIKYLNEEDHERKPEDYSNASRNFDDIFLNGDMITSNDGTKIVYNIYDENNHQINSDTYSAFSKDGHSWKVAKDRQPIEDIEGTPIEVARHIKDMIDGQYITESDNRISEIEIHDSDFQFADKLEELGYEYMLSLGGDSTGDFSITIYKETSGDEDFIIIRTDDLPNITKVDHNGESLFFNEKEVALLYKDSEEE